jgi:uncharacterized DUF497 family protein
MVTVNRLVWDSFNVPHVARHKVTPEEVEEVCQGDAVDLQSYRGRIILIGPSRAGRMLAVVLDPRGHGVYCPVTARPASRKERRYYHEQKGGGAR